MKSAPSFCSSSTIRRPSAASFTGAELGNCGTGPSSIGPEIIIRGPSIFPSAILLRHFFSASRSPPISRTPVTPFATNNTGVIFSSAGIHAPNISCTCISHSPGIRYLPRPSTILAVFGTDVAPLLPTCDIRLPSTITVTSARTGDPVASIRLTCVIARTASCPVRIAAPEPRTTRSTEMNTIFFTMNRLARGQILPAAQKKHKSLPWPDPGPQGGSYDIRIPDRSP